MALSRRWTSLGHDSRLMVQGCSNDLVPTESSTPWSTTAPGPDLPPWILEDVNGVRYAAERGDADSCVTCNRDGGFEGGLHVIDRTNANRTVLMDLETLERDDDCPTSWAWPPLCFQDCAVVRSRGVRPGARSSVAGADEVPLTGVFVDPAGGDRRPGLLHRRRRPELMATASS